MKIFNRTAMLEKRIYKAPKRLIHLSDENHDGEIFKPRVPDSIVVSEHEDDHTRRICFSDSISRAFLAINFKGNYQKLYVHVPVGIEEIVRRGKLCKPTKEQVFDADFTNEYWIKCNVRLKCIGRIYIGYSSHLTDISIRFKWLERYI